MVIFKISIFKLQDCDQGIYKHAMQNKWEFLACLKKNCQEKQKKTVFVYPVLRYAQKTKLCKQFFRDTVNVCFVKSFYLNLKKKKLVQFQNSFRNEFSCRHQSFSCREFFVVAIKKSTSHTISIYGNYMLTIFFYNFFFFFG